MLYELDLWDKWNEFERKLAEEEIQYWLERHELNLEKLSEL